VNRYGLLWVRLAAAFFAVAISLTGTVAPALAHAQLVIADPVDGAVLTEAPKRLKLTFSEPVRPLVARLIHPNGRTELLTDIGAKGTTIVLALPDGLEQGTHILSWRVASSDGHPIGGGLLFSIGVPSVVASTDAAQSDLPVRIGLWAARLLLLAGLVFGVGGAAASSWLTGTEALPGRRFVALALFVGLCATPGMIAFQGLDALAEPLPGILKLEVWQAGLWATSYGMATLVAAAALFLAYGAMQSDSRPGFGRVLAIGALALLGAAIAASGHASAAPPRWLTVPAVFFHAVAIALWLGALVPLGLALARRDDFAPIALKRFSGTIPAVIAVLLVSGGMIAIVQVRTIAALWQTDYGLVLLTKLVLVSGMFLLALFNRYMLTAPATVGDANASLRLRRSITAEIVLGTAVLAVLGLWRFTPPPRSIAENPALYETQEVRVAKDGVTALLTIQPPIVGPVRIEVGDLLLDGKPFEPIGVNVELDKPSYGIGPFAHEARRIDAGTFHADGFVLPLDGFWVVRVTVLVSDFRSVTLMDVFDVRKASR
jgi:copper transport protein